ncbi:hypothetical protein [Pedobacter sp. NJ-S-72]
MGNAVVLKPEDALKLGLHAKGQSVVFYPEWVELKGGWNSKRYEVKDVYYKGFYEELLLERNGVIIRAIQLNRGEHKKKTTTFRRTLVVFLSFKVIFYGISSPSTNVIFTVTS